MKFSLFFVLLMAGGQVLLGSLLPLNAHGLSSTNPLEMALGAVAIDRVSLSPKPPSNDRVRLETKTVTLIRGKKGQEYPNYKEATIKYPQVTGLADQALLQNIQSAVSLKSVFGQSLEELRTEFLESWWLSEIDYAVNYNQNSLLDVTFTISGVGAYPSTYEKHRLVSLKTGKVLRATDVFKMQAFGTIAVMVNKAMQAEMKEAIANGDKEGADLRDQLSKQRFQIRNLNSFSISDQGITFRYDFDFPHVMKALEPAGRYFFSYQQLKPYIKPDGALGFVLSSAGTKG
ncbi:hypothetical protein [Stenomitos frigidus]|uniref:DUF3298 domain-containing protein n=1 Tax=Stenomitos frigidus ULC18 TaxID=2107698 RepID=A0A2T1DZQ3_9CYAN|nr:hypothetical protein [Stenomitos frigidus]PSB25977.1 hypothetical protein C7B82_20955 [Stenomitos frigidus ULC18]